MDITLKYGKERIVLPTDSLKIHGQITANEVKKLDDPAKRLKEVLDSPINSFPFNDLFSKDDKVAIIISDITRAWINYPSFLPSLVSQLHSLGINDSQIAFLTATGTHRNQTDEEKRCLVGDEIFSRFDIMDHDSKKDEMISIGTTSLGHQVYINSLVSDHKVILTGGIAPHLMSGFGGGRKSILPGIASYSTIQQNHLLTLDPFSEKSSSLIGVGILENNPLHKDMMEACALLDPDFLINVTTNDQGELAEIFAGHWYDAWLEGTEWIRRHYFIPVVGKTDLVIASCGGYPKDINLYQTTKTIFNAVKAINKGGSLILLSECSDGAGADSFFNWTIPLQEGRLDHELRKDFTIPGYVFYASVEAAKKVDVFLVSKMVPQEIKKMGFIPCTSLEDAIKKVQKKHGGSPEALILPYGGSTVPVIDGG